MRERERERERETSRRIRNSGSELNDFILLVDDFIHVLTLSHIYAAQAGKADTDGIRSV